MEVRTPRRWMFLAKPGAAFELSKRAPTLLSRDRKARDLLRNRCATAVVRVFRRDDEEGCADPRWRARTSQGRLVGEEERRRLRSERIERENRRRNGGRAQGRRVHVGLVFRPKRARRTLELFDDRQCEILDRRISHFCVASRHIHCSGDVCAPDVEHVDRPSATFAVQSRQRTTALGQETVCDRSDSCFFAPAFATLELLFRSI